MRHVRRRHSSGEATGTSPREPRSARLKAPFVPLVYQGWAENAARTKRHPLAEQRLRICRLRGWLETKPWAAAVPCFAQGTWYVGSASKPQPQL